MIIDGPVQHIHQRLRRAQLALIALRTLNATLVSWSLAGGALLGGAWAVSAGWRGEGALWLLSGSTYLVMIAPLGCLALIGWRLRRRRDVAAFLEARDPSLNDALLTAIAAESNPNLGAPEVIEALQVRVRDQLRQTELRAWAPWGLARRGSIALMLTLSAWLVGFGVRGDQLYGVFKIANESPELITQRLAYTPLIGDIKLMITPPKYTGAPPRFLEGGSGDFEALEGSVVTLEATLSRRGTEAKLWIKRPENVSGEALKSGQGEGDKGEERDKTAGQGEAQEEGRGRTPLSLTREGRVVRGQFTVDESFQWSVSLTDLEGVEWREAARRQVIARPDRPPTIQIVTPTSGERVDPARDLKVSLKGKDDYGLSAVSLFVALDSDMDHPESLPLNGVQGAQWSGVDSLDLRVVEAQGGDRIALWARATDNRASGIAERGPQTANSEVVYLEIDSPEWEHRALLDKLRAHLEVQIEALAGRLEIGYLKPSDSDETPKPLGVVDLLGQWISTRQTSESAREGFDALLKRLAEDELTPEEIRLALVSKLMLLEVALEEEGDRMNGMTASANAQGDQARGASALEETMKQIRGHSEPVERAHEEIIILIEAMVARMALEEMSNLADELKASRAKIRELMKMYRDQPSDALKARIRRELQRFRQKMKAMREMMEKLQKKLPKEFLNLDGMKSDEVTKSLKESESQVSSIEQLLEEGKLDEALKELDQLSESLEEMAQQLQKDMEELHRQTNPELEKALSELMDSTRDLMRAQEEVRVDTQAQQDAIDKAIKEAQREQDELIKELREKAERIVKLERGLELERSGRYVERVRDDARKASDDLKRSLDQMMLDEGLEAAERSDRFFGSLEGIESGNSRRRRARRDRRRPRGKKQGQPQSVRDLREARELSEEVADSLREIRDRLEERAEQAREETARAQSESRAQREARERAQAQQAQGQPQPGQSGRPQGGQPSASNSGQPGSQGEEGQQGRGQRGRGGQGDQGGRGESWRRSRPGQDPGAALAQRQSKITRGLQRLQSQLQARREKIPSLHQVPTEPFERAQQASRDASSQLRDHQPGRGVEGQQQVSDSLKQVMEGLQQAKQPQRGQKPGGEGGGKPQSGSRGRRDPSTERVEIPQERERGPDALRRDLLDAMKAKPARGYDDQVKAYYDSLVR